MKLNELMMLVAAVILIGLVFMAPVNAQSGAVPVGEPLHLYIRRQPVQDMTFLYFHPPDDTYNNKARDDLSYRKTLLAKGTGNDTLTMYFPQDPESNFLQFEPNNTLKLTYNFVISAIKPTDPSNTTYKLKVRIEIDEDRDRNYDREISFEITGTADSERGYKNGTVAGNTGDLKAFDGKKGGRLRITLSREDDLDSTLTIYCGYQGYHSYFQLPYSKFRYAPDENGDDPPVVWPYVLGVAGIVVLSGAAYFYFRSKQEEKEPPAKVPERRGGRRRR
ncbi:MAG: hypothetical protein ACMUHM_03910 [Thermoplasmatota archaeon]